MLTIFFQFKKFFQSSVFQAQTISPPHFTSKSPPSWSTELCTWTSRQAWLMWSGRVEAGRPKADLFSVKILGFLQTDRAPESIPGPLLQFLPLHSTTEPPHRCCSDQAAPWVVKATARLRQVLKQLACFQAVHVHTEYVVCNRAIVTCTKGFLWNMLKVRKYGLYYKCDTSQKAQKTGITATNQLEQKKREQQKPLRSPCWC